MFQLLRAMLRELETRVLVVAAVSVVAFGTITYVLIEGWTAVDAVYFCVVTPTMVGFGDIHPTTDLGKLFTVGYIIVGVGIIAGFISERAAHRQTQDGWSAKSTGSSPRSIASSDRRAGVLAQRDVR